MPTAPAASPHAANWPSECAQLRPPRRPEREFLADLRHSGVLVQLRLSGDQVVGYRVALPSDGAEPLWLSGSQLARDLSLPILRTRWDPRWDPCWDRYVAQVWCGDLDVDSDPQPAPGLVWKRATRMLTAATEQAQHLPAHRRRRLADAVSQAANLVAVLSHRLEPELGPLYLAGASQPDRTQH